MVRKSTLTNHLQMTVRELKSFNSIMDASHLPVKVESILI